MFHFLSHSLGRRPSRVEERNQALKSAETECRECSCWSCPPTDSTQALEPPEVGRPTSTTLLKILLLKMAAPFFAIELAIMIVLHFALGPEIGWLGNFLDATLLTILAVPFLYWWVVGPLSRTLAASDEARERFRAMVESTCDWIWEVNTNMTYTYVSPKARDILGFPAEEIIGKTYLDFLAPEDQARVAAEFRNHSQAQRQFVRLENAHLHRNGRRVFLETSAVPIFDVLGNLRGYRGIHRDVTERKSAEEALLERNRLLAMAGEIEAILIRAGAARDILHHCADAICRHLDAAFARIWVLNEATNFLELQASAGLYTKLDGYHSRKKVDPSTKIGRIACERRAHRTNSVTTDEGIIDHEWAKREGMVSFAGAPLVLEGRLLGVLAMFARKPLTDFAVRALETMADSLAQFLHRKQAEEALLANSQLLRLQGTALASAANAIFITDAQGKIEWANDSFCQMSGYSPSEIVGRTPSFLKSGLHDAAFYEHMWKTILAGEVWRGEVWEQNKNGDSYVVNQVVTPLRDASGAITHFIAVHEDITARKQAETRIEYLAHHDVLTDLPNRTTFQDFLRLAMAQANRMERLMALLFIDLDKFKDVNDSLGHQMGDLLLRAVASRLRTAVRASDIVARLGGDEFAVVFTNLNHIQEAATLAQKLLDSFVPSFHLDDHEVHIGASIGVTVFPLDDSETEQLLRNADLAMYWAKREGRNCFQFYSHKMNDEIQRRLTLERELYHALENNELLLYYQPQTDIRSGKIVGYEALLRWRHPQRGVVAAKDFIQLAEESGLIVPLGAWALRQACLQNKAWHDAGFPVQRVAVNLSAAQFKQRDLAATIAETLHVTGLDPSLLELEVTESMLMKDLPTTLATLQKLHDMGVHLAIDDFGIGYSSMNYLKHFPVDKLKIDQSFIRDLGLSPESDAIIKAIIVLGHTIHKQVVAEGVETEAQLAFLLEHGCDEVQGYLFGHPLSAAGFGQLLAEDMPLPALESLRGEVPVLSS